MFCLRGFSDIFDTILSLILTILYYNFLVLLQINKKNYFTINKALCLLVNLQKIFEKMSTKKIIEYRTLYKSAKATTLKELKTTYRNFMKDIHPDTIQDDAERLKAEEQSKTIITAYHFLVSIAPETQEKDNDEYKKITSVGIISDYRFEDTVLYVEFQDGSKFEYFGVPRPIYVKMVNAETPGRFARRHIFNSYTYRSSQKIVVA